MTRIGYARVSTTDQDLTLQRQALTALRKPTSHNEVLAHVHDVLAKAA